MVIVIHQAANTGNALCYNEKKVNEGAATFFHSRNTKSVNPFMYDEKHRLKNLLNIEKMNPRAKNKCLHISFNPSTNDYLKLGDKHIRQEIDNMMGHMGYTGQPYFVYKHNDLERVHFHVVSTRIDRQTGKKIKDNYERQKMQQFVKNLEEKYQLNHKEVKQQPEFRFSPRSRNIKQNLENLFRHLNGLKEITTKTMYDEALKIFNVEIKKSGRGHIVMVTDGNGNPIRYPIRLSKFKEKPKFYQITKQINEQTRIVEKQISNSVIDKFQLGQLARDLNRLVKKRKSSYIEKRKHVKRKLKNKQRHF
jgi:hypothetical protein